MVEVFRNEGPLENEKWEFDKEGSGKYVAEDGLTDAFGEIKFIDSGDSIAKVNKYDVWKTSFWKKLTSLVHSSLLQNWNSKNNWLII